MPQSDVEVYVVEYPDNRREGNAPLSAYFRTPGGADSFAYYNGGIWHPRTISWSEYVTLVQHNKMGA